MTGLYFNAIIYCQKWGVFMGNIEEILDVLDKNGKITDKRIAIFLLKKSPKVWNLLSEELQNDVEVILYHQPCAYVCRYVWGEDSRIGLSFVVNGDILCEPGFYAEYEKKEGLCEFIYSYIKNDIIYPMEIVDPTLKEVYKNLQRKFSCNCDYSYKPFDDFSDSKKSSSSDMEYCKKSFDKQDIDIFVQEALQEYARLLGEKQLRRK